ncbi:sialate O-acetylesterase [Prolixibacteraceae bacterium]|nr:sialate O-acetylesterase [Prolixibacteraceae bacterium]
MNKLLLWIPFWSCLLLWSLVGCKTANKEADKTKTYVIYMGGQSNMVGQGRKSYLGDSIKLSPNVKFLDYSLDASLKKSDYKFGPEYGMSQVLSKSFPNSKFIFIKFAIGGASLLDWAPEYSKEKAEVTGHPEFGDMYSRFIDKIKKDIPSESFPLAFLWMQGERDAVVPVAGKEYEENLDHLIRSFRRDLNAVKLPFVIGIIDPKPERYVLREHVIQAQKDIAKDMPNVFVIETSDLPKMKDQVHYDSKGQMDLGRRFGQQIEKILKKKEHKIISF